MKTKSKEIMSLNRKEMAEYINTVEEVGNELNLVESQKMILKKMAKKSAKNYDKGLSDSIKRALQVEDSEGNTQADILASGAVALAIESQKYGDIKPTMELLKATGESVDKSEMKVNLDLRLIKDVVGEETF